MDKIFKIGLLILGTFFLLLYYFNSQNNRYILRSEETITVFDTRKGIIYATSSEAQGKWVIINPIEAKTEVKGK